MQAATSAAGATLAAEKARARPGKDAPLVKEGPRKPAEEEEPTPAAGAAPDDTDTEVPKWAAPRRLDDPCLQDGDDAGVKAGDRATMRAAGLITEGDDDLSAEEEGEEVARGRARGRRVTDGAAPPRARVGSATARLGATSAARADAPPGGGGGGAARRTAPVARRDEGEARPRWKDEEGNRRARPGRGASAPAAARGRERDSATGTARAPRAASGGKGWGRDSGEFRRARSDGGGGGPSYGGERRFSRGGHGTSTGFPPARETRFGGGGGDRAGAAASGRGGATTSRGGSRPFGRGDDDMRRSRSGRHAPA